VGIGTVQFGFAKVKGAKINLHTNSPSFWAAKLQGFTVLCRQVLITVATRKAGMEMTQNKSIRNPNALDAISKGTGTLW